eukprot:TRINITY_DN1402_c0_g3_i1.p1 TRINITY_DN1402_c0_g3~~TRINITY_DN1402_c0_g3_i1.p1  ORF type:complete len:156 (+),score=12.79 TRINITY_DN1402_c0_g3_i1:40-507(+)
MEGGVVEFTEIEKWVLKITVFVSGSLSIVGCFAIIVSYILWKDLRSNLRLLLVYLSVCDFFTATGNIVGALILPSESIECVVQSFITTLSSMASFCWTISIAIYLYLLVGQRIIASQKSIYIFHVVNWGVPLFFVSLACGFGALGYNEYSGIASS